MLRAKAHEYDLNAHACEERGERESMVGFAATGLALLELAALLDELDADSLEDAA